MRYTKTHRLFHWTTAALIVGMVGTGLAYTYDIGGKGTLSAHQIMGQILIVVLVLRIAARIAQRVGQPVHEHHVFELALAFSVHYGLYLCLIAFVVTGYVSASATTDNALLFPADLAFARSDTGEMLLETHFLLKWVLLGLLGLHICGALKHAIWDKDNTLSQMTFPPAKG